MISNLRLQKIMNILQISNKVVTGEQMCTTLGVSSRTIRSDVKELNDILKDQGAVIISEKGKGYVLNINEDKKFKDFLNKLQCKNSYMNLTAQGRAEYIIMKLLLNEIQDIEAVTQIDLADELFISLSSLKNDMKLAKSNLLKFQLDIEKNGNKGINISGEEDNIRGCINRHLQSHNKFFKENFQIIFKEYFKIENYLLVEEILKKNISKFNLRLSDIAFTNLMSYISIMLVRNKKNHNVNYEKAVINDLKEETKSDIANSICDEVEKRLNIKLNEHEVCYITKHIVASSLITANKEDKVSNLFAIDEVNSKLTEKILISIKEIFRMDLTSDEVLKDFLGNHLKASINRARYGINVANSMLTIIKNNYPFAFELGILANNIIREQLGIDLSEDDIGFLSLHFAASIERVKVDRPTKVKRVIIVCTTGVGTSLLLKVKLDQCFKDRLLIVDTIPWYEFSEEFVEDIDFIITTVPLEIKSKKVIYVKNLLDGEEVKVIEENLRSIDSNENELINKFNRQLFFKDIEVASREEVLDNITYQLIAKGYITEAVKKEIFLREQLASTEIGNLVAIPHTMHQDIGESFIAVAVLKKGITWCKENVQVVLLIGMAKKDQHQWKANLEQLYKSIINIEVVLEIIKSNDFEDFIKVIYKF